MMSRRKFFINLILIFVLLPLHGSMSNAKDAYRKYLDLAIKFQKQRRFKEAEMVFSKGITEYPSVAILYFKRAELRKDYMGGCQRAIPDYTMAIKLKKIPKAYYKRGLCMTKQGLYHIAVRDFNNCLKIRPNYGGRVYFARAEAYAKLNMVKEALRDLKLTVKHDPKYRKAVESFRRKLLMGTSFWER